MAAAFPEWQAGLAGFRGKTERRLQAKSVEGRARDSAQRDDALRPVRRAAGVWRRAGRGLAEGAGGQRTRAVARDKRGHQGKQETRAMPKNGAAGVSFMYKENQTMSDDAKAALAHFDADKTGYVSTSELVAAAQALEDVRSVWSGV